MRFNADSYIQEIHRGSGLDSAFPLDGYYYLGNIYDELPGLLNEWKNKVQLIYLDPPYMTGQDFIYTQIIENQTGIKSCDTIRQLAFSDKWAGGRSEYLSMVRFVIECCYELLSDEGSIYIHTDYRTSPYIRIIMDDIFGEDNFINEIIWHYKTGGRTKNHYSRKHDNIIFYGKTKKYYFNIDAVGFPRGKEKKNNMKRQVSEDGRVYFSIKSNGKEYRYFEDSMQYPCDVWDDISHLQQKDPERTGYETQKPARLLERVIKASSRPGDIVADFFAGSGTTLYVAQMLDRKWIGMDKSIYSLQVSRRRLLQSFLEEKRGISFSYKISHGIINNEKVEFIIEENDQHEYNITLQKYNLSNMAGSDFINYIDYWAVGYLNDNQFLVSDCSYRIRSTGVVKKTLKIKNSGSAIGAYVSDIFGKHCLTKLEL